jgi:hypothetical protein
MSSWFYPVLLAGAQAIDSPPAVQLAPPNVDVSAGAWVASAGSALYPTIDEETADDTDYIRTYSLSTAELKLPAFVDPGSAAGHTLRYRAKGDGSTDLVVRLKQGGTTIATWTETNVPSTETDYSHTLTSGEANSITDYEDLRISFEAA